MASVVRSHLRALDKAEGVLRYSFVQEPEAPSETGGGNLRFKCSSLDRERPVLLRTPLTGRARHALPAPDAAARPNPTLVLGVILATYLMIILDASVVITALPSIAERLDFSPAALSWVQSAYALTFGGLLLLGARMGDILGRRRTFVAGIALFTARLAPRRPRPDARPGCSARARVQGVGAAIAAPSSLALLTTNFREGPERIRALAAYGAVAGGGGSVGLVLGGMLTDWISWRWGLWINVPVGIALIWLAPRVLPETERAPGPLRPARRRRLDRRHDRARLRLRPRGRGRLGRRGDRRVVRRSASSCSRRSSPSSAAPCSPSRRCACSRAASGSGAYLARMLLVGGMFSMFFFLSQYLQGVRGFSPLQAGLGVPADDGRDVLDGPVRAAHVGALGRCAAARRRRVGRPRRDGVAEPARRRRRRSSRTSRSRSCCSGSGWAPRSRR